MKLLFVTQKIDERDPVLGFVVGWLSTIVRHFEVVSVVCLRRGEAKLPLGVKVYSLGKEHGVSRTVYIYRFFRLIASLRSQYDGVFVHMNPEYVILGGLFWRLLGKKVVFWYNHTFGDWRANLAMRLSDVICHTSPYSFSARTAKSVRMPAGIDTSVFRPKDIPRTTDILYLGRISEVKKIHVLIEAVKIIYQKGKFFPTLKIVGPTVTDEDRKYLNKLFDLRAVAISVARANQPARALIDISDAPVLHKETPKVFGAALVCVNLTPMGNYDKTVLESAACGSIPIVSSVAFADAFPKTLFFEEGNPESLARTIENVLLMEISDRVRIIRDASAYVDANHSLDRLALEIRKLY
jgi:glycosyltransferase involved in cell wall biosynthesis